MAQIFDAPSKAILRSQIAEHIAETDKNDKRELQAGEEPLPNDRFFDRELSWLKFNKRVLELAQDEDLPVIERASFAAIFANNLDEFFMVRVAGLKRRIDTGIAVTAASGLSPRQQLRAISEQAHRLQDEHAHYIIDHILPDLAKEQIVLLSWDKLTAAEQERLSRYYRQQVFPVLTPLAVDPAQPVPVHFRRFPQPRRAGGESGIRQVALRPREGSWQPEPTRAGRRSDRRREHQRALWLHHHGEPDHRPPGIPCSRA